MCVVVVLTVLLAPPAFAQSLWREGAPGASIFADHRARAVNDIVTIVVVEQSTQSRSASTKTSKDTSRLAALNDFPGLMLPTRNAEAAANLKLDLSGKAAHEGKGSIDRSDRLTAQIPAPTRYGTASLVACASPPPAAGPIAFPTAQAAFITPKLSPCASPTCSAAWESIVSAGA